MTYITKTKKLLASALIGVPLAFSSIQISIAQSPAELNDLEIAHVAYTADLIDIQYAHLALALTNNPAIKEFANTMIRDHEAVNEQALALLERLGVDAQDNFLSQKLIDDSKKIINEMSQLRGAEFDKYYATNELAYHQAVNGLVGDVFIPNIDNSEVKKLFKAGYEIFKAHEGHAAMMVKGLQ